MTPGLDLRHGRPGGRSRARRWRARLRKAGFEAAAARVPADADLDALAEPEITDYSEPVNSLEAPKMAEIRMRPLGNPWSIVSVPDNPGESQQQQLLGLFSRALGTVSELSYLPHEPEEFTVFWDGSRLSVYHDSVEDQAVFRAEPTKP